MRLRLSDCIYNKSPAAGDAKTACIAEYIQSFEGDLEGSEGKDIPWIVRMLTPGEATDSRHMQYRQARSHLATARAYLENNKTDRAVDEILLARQISVNADEEYLDGLRKSIDRGSGAAKVLLATGTSLVVIGTAGGAAAYIGGGAAAVYGTSTVGGLLAVTGFSTMAGAGGGLLAGGVLAGTRSLAMGVPYNYSVDEQIQYATFGGAVGLLQGSFPFAVRTGMGWARDINPGAGTRGTLEAIAKKSVELTPVAITQGTIFAAQVKMSGGSNSEVAAGAAIGAAIPFVYSGMMVAFRFPVNLKVLTWRDPRFPNEYARVIFYDGIERPYQVYSYRVTEGEPPLAEIRISTPGTLPARTAILPISDVKGTGVLRDEGRLIMVDDSHNGKPGNYTLENDAEKARLESQGKYLYGGDNYLGSFLRDGIKILDAGCGVGTIGRAIAAKYPNTKVVGIDANKGRLEEACSLAVANKVDSQVSFVHGDAYSLPFPNDNFDIANARFVFMHLTDPERALAEMLRVTKKGGRVILHEGFHDAIWITPDRPYFRRIMEIWKQFMTERGQDHSIGVRLHTLLKSAGLRDIRVDILTHSHPGTDPLFAAYLRDWTQHLPSLRESLAGRITNADIAGMQQELSNIGPDHYYLELTVVGSGEK